MARLVLPEADRAVLREMRHLDILADVESHRLKHSKGAVIVPCSDGDQMLDLMEQQQLFFLESGGALRPHTVALNGGPLLISPVSPISRGIADGEVLLRHILNGLAMKEMESIILYGHAPCGAAAGAKVDVIQALSLVLDAKHEIRHAICVRCENGEEFGLIQIACFIHVDWGDEGKNTYWLNEEEFLSWVLSH